jgi:DNA-binding transcriptional LysR family regulator
MRMDIQDMEIFARVAALQNLSAVGTELGLTPGTISKRIQALEEDLSVRLFERTTRSIRITEEGSSFLQHVERILQELDEARASMAASSGKPKGKLKVAAPHALARAYMAPAVLAFIEAYPEIDVQIDLTDRPVNLQEDGYDVAIHAGPLGDSALIAKRLAPDRQVIVAAPAYIVAHGLPAIPDDLVRHQCLAQGDAWSWSFLREGAEANVRINTRLRSDSHEMLRLAAITGLGLMRTSELLVADELKSGALTRVLEAYDLATNSGVFALYLNGRHVLPRLRVFLDFLADCFRELRQRSIAETAPGGPGTDVLVLGAIGHARRLAQRM